MNTQNNLAIWVSSASDIDIVPKVLEKFPDVDDICLVTNGAVYHTDFASIPLFYITFCDMHIVFLSVSDYLANKDKLRSKKLYICLSTIEDIDMRSIQEARIIEL